MTARIEIAEVVSFRLKLPLAELERLPREVASELPLQLGRDRSEWLLEYGDCALRFRPINGEAVLTEIAICNDDHGLFFQRVLGPLLVRFEGDCELRLVWNAPDRNTHGDFAAVTVRNGQTNYPGLSAPAQALRSALVSGSVPGAKAAPKNELAVVEEPIDEATLKEVDALLQKAREQFAEYQRRKSNAGGAKIA